METLRQWLDGDRFSRQEELIFADCDSGRKARVATFLSIAAAAAGHDYDLRGLPYEKLYGMGQAFLLSRVALRLHRRPGAREVVTVRSWEDGAHGAHVRRAFQFEDEAGAVCASMKSDWILVDTRTRRILRPAAFTAKLLTVCPVEIDCPECGKLALGGGAAEELGVWTVRYSDLDGNGHLYSGNYGDIFWDFLPPDLQGTEPLEFFLNYSREAVLNDEIRLLGVRDGGEYRMEGRVDGELCFAARCRFA